MTAALTAPTKLKGQDLLDYVKGNSDQLRDEVVKGAGYWTTIVDKETGEARESLQYTAFSEAFMEASGVVLKRPKAVRASTGTGEGKGKAPTFRLMVGTKGVLPIGTAYTGRAGMEPGQFVLVSFGEGEITVELDPDQSPDAVPALNEQGAIGRYNDGEPVAGNGTTPKAKKEKVAA
jgi:hypothetical protein